MRITAERVRLRRILNLCQLLVFICKILCYETNGSACFVDRTKNGHKKFSAVGVFRSELFVTGKVYLNRGRHSFHCEDSRDDKLMVARSARLGGGLSN